MNGSVIHKVLIRQKMATLIHLTIFDIISMLLQHPIEDPTEDWDAEAEADPEPPFEMPFGTAHYWDFLYFHGESQKK